MLYLLDCSLLTKSNISALDNGCKLLLASSSSGCKLKLPKLNLLLENNNASILFLLLHYICIVELAGRSTSRYLGMLLRDVLGLYDISLALINAK